MEEKKSMILTNENWGLDFAGDFSRFSSYNFVLSFGNLSSHSPPDENIISFMTQNSLLPDASGLLERGTMNFSV